MNKRTRMRWIMTAGGLLILTGLLKSVFIPDFVTRPRSEIFSIVNNLRRLDGAVQTWALEHGKTGAVHVTLQDVAPYVGGVLEPVAGERYVLKTISDSPEAHLTRGLEGRPLGTVLRLNTNGALEVVLPTK